MMPDGCFSCGPSWAGSQTWAFFGPSLGAGFLGGRGEERLGDEGTLNQLAPRDLHTTHGGEQQSICLFPEATQVCPGKQHTDRDGKNVCKSKQG
eukprot:245372-Pelagomonas_calceolata.AAC.1